VREREGDAVATVHACRDALRDDVLTAVHLDPVVAALEPA
jgi:hypothetical protein